MNTGKPHGNKASTKKLWENPEYRRRMSEAHKGQKAWNKGIKTGLVPKSAFKKGQVGLRNGVHLSEETKRKLSLKLRGRIILSTRGERNWNLTTDTYGGNKK